MNPALFLSLFMLFSACGNREDSRLPDPTPAFRIDSAVTSWLGRYDLQKKKPQTFTLSSKLGEISGLTLTADGRVFCHDDESPIVYELDYRTGETVKRFTVGSGFMEEDFEGIASKQDTLFLVNSGGEIFEFREAGDGGHSDFRLYRTFLTERNDVEGVEYDPATDCLLLACKGDPGNGYRGLKTVYAFSLKHRRLIDTPRFLIPLKEVEKKARKGNFNPSGIALHPVAGTFFIISADGALAIEIDRSGRILDQQSIHRKANPQPEGITFLPDGTMLLANDGQGERGTLTVYPVRKE